MGDNQDALRAICTRFIRASVTGGDRYFEADPEVVHRIAAVIATAPRDARLVLNMTYGDVQDLIMALALETGTTKPLRTEQ